MVFFLKKLIALLVNPIQDELFETVCDVIKKILSRDSNYILDEAM